MSNIPRQDDGLDKLQYALDRMKVAFDSRKGIRLSWEELEAMNRSFIGELWNEDNPLNEL